jgi:beta-galactosidase
MRHPFPLDRGWLFAPRDLALTAPDADFETVHLPHTNRLLPHHNFDNAEYQFISTYRRHFTLSEPLAGRRLFLEFDGAMLSATVWLNGRRLGEHDGGFVPFRFDITDHVADGDNTVQVRLDSTERPDIPPYGYIVDYLTFGGIYRSVRLLAVEPVYVADVFVKPLDVLKTPRAEVVVTVANTTDADREVVVYVSAVHAAGPDAGAAGGDGQAVVRVKAGEQAETVVAFAAPGAALWSLDRPNLYTANVCLDDAAAPSAPFDVVAARFGFREAVFRDDGFYLNGERVKLRGLNRHQNYPYIGAAAPARLQRRDADILKDELSLNIVRTSHYPQSPHFLDRCDEIGLLVFEEIPGWQFIGDRDWQALSLRDVQSMIMRDRNHPSIIIWGVRINESLDDDAFYTATNEAAHQLDPTRQTGGVRNFPGSTLLEDVFTYNDFSNSIIEPPHTPFLVTEFNGHMFPTKSYDAEERQVEHALRHARVQDKSAAMARVTGAIGWCAFDYNTHREFGAGDRICYHGVSDIFRLPKFAADFYASQVSPRVRPVVRAATFWTFGERAEAGVEPLWVFSNCDALDVYKGDQLEGRFLPDREAFPHLEYPPFRVMGFPLLAMVGVFYQDLRIVGLVDGQPVAEQQISSEGLPHALTLTADDAVIDADGADMTRLVFRIVDKFGNRLPYHTCVVGFAIEGEGALIGENPFALVGGHAAVYVRATTTPGLITVTARIITTYGNTLAPATVTVGTR